ncbi:hypothetical protein L6164_002872 [Bauhinia variegata]|uniref:Uncharacterized protein n=1 Tax=Bauhinia variegata TaxID=167791 RepID=A0ACB9Q2B2_BAUVA|nr:hypothetical protein L6164_002872 [Bauhinia variegata]
MTIERGLKELINHPNIMEKARKEIDSVIGKDRIVTEADIANLPYLQAVVKETLRLHPPGPLLLRKSTAKCTVAGYDIPANTWLFINVWALSRDSKYWDDPLEFFPERFLRNVESGNVSQMDVRGKHYQLLPFGSGRRGCPAVSLALNIVQFSLAAMIQCFEWKIDDGENACVDVLQAPVVTRERTDSLICKPVPRLVPFPSSSN